MKVTSKTTLYELKEHCKKVQNCKRCSFYNEKYSDCSFIGTPEDWKIGEQNENI